MTGENPQSNYFQFPGGCPISLVPKFVNDCNKHLYLCKGINTWDFLETWVCLFISLSVSDTFDFVGSSLRTKVASEHKKERFYVCQNASVMTIFQSFRCFSDLLSQGNKKGQSWNLVQIIFYHICKNSILFFLDHKNSLFFSQNFLVSWDFPTRP